jgi:hypothetical protein
VSIEDDIAHRLSMEIAKEIDCAVMAEILESAGWFSIRCSANVDEVQSWLNKNCEDESRILGYKVLFVSKHDATLFKLTWG